MLVVMQKVQYMYQVPTYKCNASRSIADYLNYYSYFTADSMCRREFDIYIRIFFTVIPSVVAVSGNMKLQHIEAALDILNDVSMRKTIKIKKNL